MRHWRQQAVCLTPLSSRPYCKKQFEFKTFSSSAPKLRHALPQAWRKSEPSSAFRRKLKTHLLSNQWFHHHPFLSLFLSFSGGGGLCFVCLFCLSSGKETAPACATSMDFPGMFGHSINWQSSSSSFITVLLQNCDFPPALYLQRHVQYYRYAVKSRHIVFEVLNTGTATVIKMSICTAPRLSGALSALQSSSMRFLADLLKIYAPSRQLRYSADTCTQCIP